MKTSLKIGMLIAAAGIHGSAWGIISKYNITVKNATTSPITVYWTMKDNDKDTTKTTDGKEVPAKKEVTFTEYDRSNLGNLIRAGRRIIVVDSRGNITQSNYVDSEYNYVEVKKDALNIMAKSVKADEDSYDIRVTNKTIYPKIKVYWAENDLSNAEALVTSKTTNDKIEILKNNVHIFSPLDRINVSNSILIPTKRIIIEIEGQRFSQVLADKVKKVTINNIIELGRASGLSDLTDITVDNQLGEAITVCWAPSKMTDSMAVVADTNSTTSPTTVQPGSSQIFGGTARSSLEARLAGGRKIIINYLGQKFTRTIEDGVAEVIIKNPIQQSQ